eukprot:4870669-Pleurochrysis_carterae.AAC.4
MLLSACVGALVGLRERGRRHAAPRLGKQLRRTRHPPRSKLSAFTESSDLGTCISLWLRGRLHEAVTCAGVRDARPCVPTEEERRELQSRSSFRKSQRPPKLEGGRTARKQAV